MDSKEKIERLEDERRQLTARIQDLKARQAASERKRDTRRKVLVGAVVLAAVEAGEFSRGELLGLLDRRLKNERDRQLFELPAQHAATKP